MKKKNHFEDILNKWDRLGESSNRDALCIMPHLLIETSDHTIVYAIAKQLEKRTLITFEGDVPFFIYRTEYAERLCDFSDVGNLENLLNSAGRFGSFKGIVAIDVEGMAKAGNQECMDSFAAYLHDLSDNCYFILYYSGLNRKDEMAMMKAFEKYLNIEFLEDCDITNRMIFQFLKDTFEEMFIQVSTNAVGILTKSIMAEVPEANTLKLEKMTRDIVYTMKSEWGNNILTEDVVQEYIEQKGFSMLSNEQAFGYAGFKKRKEEEHE